MNDSIKRISLDIHRTSSSETVNAKRGDTGRTIHISLVDGGVPYIISEDCYAVFTAKKPDEKVVFNDCSIEKNTIIYEVTEQTVAVEGRVNCEIKLYGADGNLITSPRFTILVYGTVYNEGDEIESSDEFNALTSLMADTQKAVKEAQEAVADAQEAIKTAQEMEASLLITEASGSPVVIDNAADHSLIGLKLYGKTTQAGTPTPEAPVELVSVGDGGSITVSVTGESKSQNMSIFTPNGLPGIPVASGGNYTDADGQQWISDKIDFARGVYVRNIETLNGKDIAWKMNNVNHTGDGRCFYIDTPSPSKRDGGISNRFRYTDYRTWEYMAIGEMMAYNRNDTDYIVICVDATINSTNALIEWFEENHTEIFHIIPASIEKPLFDEELVAYATLHTYRNNTTVSNDASAHMELEYVMDAKKYIDSISGGGAAPARLASVTILASKWTGSDSLYSQVVTINGITPYSKVDLLPSVEQLAIFHNKDVAFVTENEDGVVTVYAIGEKPVLDYTMQAQITEVEV